MAMSSDETREGFELVLDSVTQRLERTTTEIEVLSDDVERDSLVCGLNMSTLRTGEPCVQLFLGGVSRVYTKAWT